MTARQPVSSVRDDQVHAPLGSVSEKPPTRPARMALIASSVREIASVTVGLETDSCGSSGHVRCSVPSGPVRTITS